MSQSTPIIITLIGSYLPGYKGGGPIRSIANLVEILGDELDFKIITRDRDLGSPCVYAGIKVNEWQKLGKSEVLYMAPGKNTFSFLRRLINPNENNIIYLNSFFSPAFALRPLLLYRLGLIKSKKVILAPRGEFSPGALQFKWLRKRLYILFSKMIGLYDRVLWQATSERERSDILRCFRKAQVVIAPVVTLSWNQNGSILSGDADRTKRSHMLKIAFLSRISPKKNLASALAMLHKVKGKIEFSIYGPVEDESYWQECRSIIESMPPDIHVNYAGPISHNLIGSVLSQNDLFFFPTHGENFGHVIVEALTSGLPILISDQTPWRNLEKAGVGWDLPLDKPEAFTAVLQKCVDMDAEEWRALSQRAREYGLEKIYDKEIVAQNRALFLTACASKR